MDKRAQLIGRYLDSIGIFNEIEKQPKSYGTEELIYNSEIETLMIIGEMKSVNLTNLAHELGISKSGTTRFVKKLEKKKLIVKGKKDGNAKEVIFKLTKLGKLAYAEKGKFNKDMYLALYTSLSNYTDDELLTIEKFLLQLSDEMRHLL